MISGLALPLMGYSRFCPFYLAGQGDRRDSCEHGFARPEGSAFSFFGRWSA